jgi:hypothetical protein
MNVSSLPEWPRRYYEQPGGKPFLFFVVYGQFGKLPTVLSSQYRSAGIPSGMELFLYDAEHHPEVLARFQGGYLWQSLQARNAVLADLIARSAECLILRGEIEDCDNLNYLRDSVGLLAFLLDHGGITVYDPFMFQWWEPDDWRQRIFDPAGPVPRHHTIILTSEESDYSLTWFHTRGMRKFGRPDLSVHNVPANHHEAVIDLCSRFIELQAFGGASKKDKKSGCGASPKAWCVITPATLRILILTMYTWKSPGSTKGIEAF